MTRDGFPVGVPSLGASLPVDPGDHVIIATTPDGVAHETRVTTGRGEHRLIEADLRPLPPPPPRAPLAPVAPLPSPSPLRAVGWVAGGIGVAGLALGIVGGALVLGRKDTIHAHCGSDGGCDSVGFEAADHARTFGITSDVGFAVGAAGLVAWGVLLLASARQPRRGSAFGVRRPVGTARRRRPRACERRRRPGDVVGEPEP